MRDGTILLDTHHSPPPPYELYGAPYTSVSDEESLYNGSSSEKKMKARKRPKRGTSMRNKK
jgi:hypothetical protein